VAALLALSALAFAQGPFTHDIRPGYGVTSIGWLSDYLPALRGSPGDTRVYFLESGAPGGTAVVLGGTHPNEIAGIMAAVILVEKATVQAGRLIVIPHANNAAFGYPDPRCPSCGPWVTFHFDGATRSFRYGLVSPTRHSRPRIQQCTSIRLASSSQERRCGT